MLKELNKVLGKLATTNRYSDTRLINPESVLEHTGYVAMLAMFIVDELNRKGEELDALKVLKKALLHDIEEATIGDIINSTKYANNLVIEGIKQYSTDCAYNILDNLSKGYENFLLWTNSKTEKEGLIIHLADKLAVVYKMEQEILKFGNLHLKEYMHPGLDQSLEDLKTETIIFKNENILIDIINEGINICKKISEYT